ncbi:MAG: hypothetical protein Q7V53_03020 [Caldisericota bacterium]|nr:hypothetical protein [Caldisericota bacterium]
MKQHPDGSEGSGKRGRPKTGKPEQVRLPAEDKSFALELGSGNLSKGVRESISIARNLKNAKSMSADLRALAEIRAALAVIGEESDDPRQMLLSLRRAARAIARRATTGGHIKLDKDGMQTALELGKGDTTQGTHIALSVARFLGIDTTRKMDPNGTDSAIPKR